MSKPHLFHWHATWWAGRYGEVPTAWAYTPSEAVRQWLLAGGPMAAVPEQRECRAWCISAWAEWQRQYRSRRTHT